MKSLNLLSFIHNPYTVTKISQNNCLKLTLKFLESCMLMYLYQSLSMMWVTLTSWPIFRSSSSTSWALSEWVTCTHACRGWPCKKGLKQNYRVFSSVKKLFLSRKLYYESMWSIATKKNSDWVRIYNTLLIVRILTFYSLGDFPLKEDGGFLLVHGGSL